MGVAPSMETGGCRLGSSGDGSRGASFAPSGRKTMRRFNTRRVGGGAWACPPPGARNGAWASLYLGAGEEAWDWPLTGAKRRHGLGPPLERCEGRGLAPLLERKERRGLGPFLKLGKEAWASLEAGGETWVSLYFGTGGET